MLFTQNLGQTRWTRIFITLITSGLLPMGYRSPVQYKTELGF